MWKFLTFPSVDGDVAQNRAWRLGIDYGVSLLSVVIATLIRIWLDPILGEGTPFATFTFSIMFAAWYSGMGPALLAMALGFISAAYFFVSPRNSVAMSGLEAQTGAALYVIVGIFSIIFAEIMHRAQRRAKVNAAELLRKQADLEHEVRERGAAQLAYVNLLRQFVNVQEEERRRISRELHDQCGQELTALTLGLKFLEASVNENPEAHKRLANLQELVSGIAREVHHLALELRPAALDELGLSSALTNHLETWSSRTGIQVDFETHGLESRLPNEVETAIYRSLQEALTNVAKHTTSKNVSVILTRRDREVLAIVEDEGPGFDIESIIRDAGLIQRLGLLGMRERIEAVGGRLDIESAPDAGTTIYARVPLIEEQGKSANE